MSRLIKLTSGTIALLLIWLGSGVAEDKPPLGYVPSLGDLMVGIQLRHSKVWFAAKLENWPLADYELTQLNKTLKEASRIYPDMPASDLTGTGKLLGQITESLKEKNDAKFSKNFAEVTAACNSCHEAADRSFINIRRPTFPSPFANQIFSPRKKANP